MVAPGAPDRQRVVARPVEIDQHAARDERRVERLRAVEALLLGDREEELERPVLDRGVVRDGHGRRDADAVVGAERRSVGAHPVVLDDERRSAPRAGRTGCSGSRSQTMSRCDWRTTVGAPLATRRRGHAHDDVALRVHAARRARAPPPTRGRARAPALPASEGGRSASARRSAPRGAPARARRARRRSSAQRERRADDEQRDPEHARPRERDSARRRTSRSDRSTAASPNWAAMRNAVVATTPMRGPATVIARTMKTLIDAAEQLPLRAGDRFSDPGERASRDEQRARARGRSDRPPRSHRLEAPDPSPRRP